MEDLLDKVKISASDAIKFIAFVVTPLTVGYLDLKHDLNLNTTADASALLVVEEQKVINTRILNKLEVIGEDVAEIKGKLSERK